MSHSNDPEANVKTDNLNDRFKENENRHKADFKAEHDAHGVPILGMAKRDGAEPPRTVAGFVKRYILIEEGHRVYDTWLPPNEAIYEMKDFQVATENRFEVSKTEKSQRVTYLSKRWRADPNRKTARRLLYAPGKRSFFFDQTSGLAYVNSFFFPNHPEVDGISSLFLDHIRYLYGDETERMLDYLAHVIQRPDQRPSVVHLHIAKQHGLGRGWINDLVQRLVGSWNCSSTKIGKLADAAEGGFTDFYNDKLWSDLAEVRQRGADRFAVDDRVRDILISPSIAHNPKYGRQRFDRCYTRTFMCSNHLDALNLPEEDRRIWVTSCHDTPKPPEYYGTLYAALDDPQFVAQVFTYLKRRKITFELMGRAPDTEAKQELIRLSMSEADQDIAGLEDLEIEGGGKVQVATFEQICEALHAWKEQEKSVLRGSLRERYTTYQPPKNKSPKLKIDGRTQRVWILGNPNDWRNATTEAIREQITLTQKAIDKAEEDRTKSEGDGTEKSKPFDGKLRAVK